jgi:hypothetical protein
MPIVRTTPRFLLTVSLVLPLGACMSPEEELNERVLQCDEAEDLDWVVDKQLDEPAVAVAGDGGVVIIGTHGRPELGFEPGMLAREVGSWTRTGVGAPINGIWSGAGESFAVGDDASIFHATHLSNGALSWEPVEVRGLNDDEAQRSLYGIHGDAATGSVFAVGERGLLVGLEKDPDGVLYFDNDSAAVPTALRDSDLHGIFGNGTDWIIVGDGGAIAQGSSNGFTQLTSGTGVGLRGIFGNGTDFIVVGEGGTILRGSGNDWTKLDSGTDSGLRGIFGAGGTDWMRRPPGVGGGARGIFGAGGTEFIIVGDNGTILHGDGEVFEQVLTPTTEDLTSVGGANRGLIFATGAEGSILHLSPSSCL